MSAGLKFVSVAAALTLVVGLLAAVGLVAPSDDPVAPVAAPVDDATAFPTGTFVALERPGVYWEFNEDGTGRSYLHPGSFRVNIHYATVGNLWTQMTDDSPLGSDRHVPVTYYWDYDDELLTFELWGEEVNPHTRGEMMAYTYRLLPGKRLGLVARVDIPAGETLEPWMALPSLVVEHEAGAEPFKVANDVDGYVAAVAIEQGQTLSRDLFKPAG